MRFGSISFAARSASPLPNGERSICAANRVRALALSIDRNPSPGATRRPLPMGEVNGARAKIDRAKTHLALGIKSPERVWRFRKPPSKSASSPPGGDHEAHRGLGLLRSRHSRGSLSRAVRLCRLHRAKLYARRSHPYFPQAGCAELFIGSLLRATGRVNERPMTGSAKQSSVRGGPWGGP